MAETPSRHGRPTRLGNAPNGGLPSNRHVVGKLADVAETERRGDARFAVCQTRYLDNEPAMVTELRRTLCRRRYKFDTEKA
ncbi:MAG: hypothetical protein AAF664_15865, partial [Planctomycetota bacterium]